MKIHKGPFHMNSVTTKNPKYIMNELVKVLESQRIQYRNVDICLFSDFDYYSSLRNTV